MQPGKLLSAAALSLLIPLASSSAAKDKNAQSAGQRGYIETSYLIAPRRVGDFVLEGSQYDENQKYSGAGFRYVADGHQETRIDVYVYPAGRMEQATALNTGMEAFRADLARATDAKAYTNLFLQNEQEFLLVNDENVDGEPPQDRNATAILEAIASATRPSGRKLAMTMNLQPRDWPMHSNGYLFYKQLYYFKVRATATQDRITAEQFNALADRAARTLMPAIEVVNVGECANSVITIAANASPEEASKALVKQATEHQGYNCHATEQAAEIKKKSADAEVIDISYKPQEWKSE